MAGETKTILFPLAILAGAAAGLQPFDMPSAKGFARYAATAIVHAADLEEPGVKARAERLLEAPTEAQSARTAITRLGTESPELRALRRADANLFPDDEPLDLSENPPALQKFEQPEMCQAPEIEKAEGLFRRQGDWLQGLTLPDVPVRRSPVVAKYVRYFSANAEGRKLFASWLRRSGRYRQIIADELAKAELPRDLVAVPFIESGMWPTAVSSAGAVGLWQFMPKTARAYGLAVERGYDERRSIFASTRAAVEHFKDLHARFRSWDLAIASYNAGYSRLDNAMQDNALEDFWALARVDGALARETVLYVPKVLAVMVVLNNLSYFGFEGIEYDAPVRATEMEVPGGIRLSQLARATGSSVRELKELNPELVSDLTPRRSEPVFLHVPSSGVARAQVMLPKLLSDQSDMDLGVSSQFDWSKDEFDSNGRTRLERTGPSSDLARSLRMRRDSFFDAADEDEFEDSSSLLRRGRRAERIEREDAEPLSERLRRAGALPEAPEAAEAPEVAAGARQNTEKTAESRSAVPAFEHYVVRRGDTLSEIAAAYGVSDDEIRESNGIGPRGQLFVGQELKIQTRKTKDFFYRVSPGDTVSEIAHEFSTNVHMIKRDNRLKNPSLLPAGRTLRIRLPEGATETAAEETKED